MKRKPGSSIFLRSIPLVGAAALGLVYFFLPRQLLQFGLVGGITLRNCEQGAVRQDDVGLHIAFNHIPDPKTDK